MTVIQQLVDHRRSGTNPSGKLGSLLGENFSGSVLDALEVVLNDYAKTRPVVLTAIRGPREDPLVQQ